MNVQNTINKQLKTNYYHKEVPGMKKFIPCFFLFLLWAGHVSAANHYVRSGSSGNGSDWANAYGQLPAKLVRGDTYYIARGTYGSYGFNTPLSGTSYITIKKAINTDHGTDVGWQSAYGDGQAVFDISSVSSGHWKIDGQSRTGLGSGHGLKFENRNPATGTKTFRFNNAVFNVIFTYVELAQAGANFTTDRPGHGDIIYSTSKGTRDITISHCYLHDTSREFLLFQNAKNLTIEHNFFETSSERFGTHTNNIRIWTCDNIIYRYNVMKDAEGTGFITGAWGTTNLEAYGNVFYRSPEAEALGRGYCSRAIGDLSDPDEAPAVNWYFYNNTFVNTSGSNGGFTFSGSPRNINIYNNLWANCKSKVIHLSGAHDYNSFYNNTSTTFAETNKETSSQDPFVDWKNGDFHLKAPTKPGKSNLGSAFSVDMDGVSRGGDGLWDRGAFEFGGGEPTVIQPVVSPEGGGYTASVLVTLSSYTAGAEIRYTTDGSIPTASSNLYTKPFTLTTNTTIKAIGFKNGLKTSLVKSVNFIVIKEGDPGAVTVIEAEDMTLDGKYIIDTDAPHNGTIIKVDFALGVPTTGIATSIFSGNTGTYTITLTGVTEIDGKPRVKLYVGSNLILDEVYIMQPGFVKVDFTVKNVAVNKGDLIKIEGTSNTVTGAALARVDKITFTVEQTAILQSAKNFIIGHRFSDIFFQSNQKEIVFPMGKNIDMNTSLTIYNMSGGGVATSSGQFPSWNGSHNGRPVNRGIYFYVLKHDKTVYHGKIIKN